MRISDWSSDVCSSDLGAHRRTARHARHRGGRWGRGRWGSAMTDHRLAEERKPRFARWLTEPMLRNKDTYIKVAAAAALINIFGLVTDRKSTRLNSSH